MILAVIALLAAEAVAPAAIPAVLPPAAVAEPDPPHMTPKEIIAFNASLTPKHPMYIRCKSQLETGSLVKREKICRTNKQWARNETLGNQTAREAADAMRSRFQRSN